MQPEKDFLLEKLDLAIENPKKRFITNFCLETPREPGYRPGFSHFEIVNSGKLPITLPKGGSLAETELSQNDILYLIPNAWVGRKMDTKRKLLVINLHSEGIECYFSQHLPEHPEGYMPRKTYFTSSGIDMGCQHILKSFEFYSMAGSRHMQEQLFNIFLEAVRSHIKKDDGKNKSKTYFTYKMILQFIRDNCCSNINRNSVAREFALSPDYITHLFNKYNASSFNHVLQQCKMEQAASFLRNTQMNVNQTALLCGFNETSYFIKVFRRFYGTTPAEYCSKMSDEKK